MNIYKVIFELLEFFIRFGWVIVGKIPKKNKEFTSMEIEKIP